MNPEDLTKWGEKRATLQEVKLWYSAETNKLKKWIGFNFTNHLFISEKGVVAYYYDYSEYKIFRRKLKGKLDNNFFGLLCDNYIRFCGEINKVKEQYDIKELITEMWTILCIFNEIDENPKIANKYIQDKLLEVREKTHKEYYRLRNKLILEVEPEDYIYYKGKQFNN